MNSIKLILFDFDGTISDSHEAAIEVYNSMSAKFKFRPMKPEEMDELKSKTSREILKRLGISVFKLPFVVREARLKFQDRIHALQPFQGIPHSLSELKRLGFKIGILTSNSSANVSQFLKANDLDIFDVVYTGASIFGKSKVIKSLLKKGRFSPQEAVYVGDETRDIEAAKAAGIKVISVSWGFNTREVLQNQKPDFLIDSPHELPEVCQTIFV